MGEGTPRTPSRDELCEDSALMFVTCDYNGGGIEELPNLTNWEPFEYWDIDDMTDLVTSLSSQFKQVYDAGFKAGVNNV